MVDPHTIATFSFAQLRRDPDFRPRFPWLQNTVVCVESDLATDVLEGMKEHYLAGKYATLACYYPEEHQFRFLKIVGPYTRESRPEIDPAHVAHNRRGEFTIGMLIGAVYFDVDDDIAALTRGEFSTVEVEKKLALT